ncbi:hypothetical protein M0802_003580 [Mischocyttarus mexicanus]|nr:hypothetical protein M0802_003580 [Mischocyttarus mexicanus]
MRIVTHMLSRIGRVKTKNRKGICAKTVNVVVVVGSGGVGGSSSSSSSSSSSVWWNDRWWINAKKKLNSADSTWNSRSP